MTARNRLRIEINIHEKLCVKLVIYDDRTKIHGQQNINLISYFSYLPQPYWPCYKYLTPEIASQK